MRVELSFEPSLGGGFETELDENGPRAWKSLFVKVPKPSADPNERPGMPTGYEALCQMKTELSPCPGTGCNRVWLDDVFGPETCPECDAKSI